MAVESIQEVGRILVNCRLLTTNELEESLSESGLRKPEEFVAFLEQRQILSTHQAKKILKGDTFGYFYGRFKVQYQIAAGSFGRVFRGVDVETGDPVAIKVLRRRHIDNPDALGQFTREAEFAKKLSHPAIVSVIESGKDALSGALYMSMEFIEGGNFREFLRIRKKLQPAEMLHLAIQMAEGLEHALSHGITHRDVKLTNILVTYAGKTKWIDFGLGGKIEGDGDKQTFVADQRSVDYAGLEKATGVPKGDPRSDIFFLGAIFYQMLSGDPPMSETRDRFARMYASRFKNIVPLSTETALPPDLTYVVDKMLTFRPENRYQDYQSILHDLRRVRIEGAGILGRAEDTVEENIEEAKQQDSGPPRIMVVHHSTNVQDIIRSKLSKHGYQVAMMTDMDRALGVFRLRPAHCVIIDLETTGPEALQSFDSMRAHAKRAGRDCAGIFLVEAGHESWTQELESDGTATLTKPLKLGQVYDEVKRLAPRRKEGEPANG